MSVRTQRAREKVGWDWGKKTEEEWCGAASLHLYVILSLCDMILSFLPSALKQSTWKFSASLLGHLTQESSSISFLLAGRNLLYHWNKRLVCCSCYSHHGDFVWAHDRVGVIVSLQICHSVCQRGSKHNSPLSENMADIWKIPPSNNSNKDRNYKIRTQRLRSFSNGALHALLQHTCSSGKYIQVESGFVIASVCVPLSKGAQWTASEYL